MTWDSPWFVGGGAMHSPEVARLLAYAATSGSEGVVGIGDLTVRALEVPGGKVRVSPGAAIIRNRSTGGSQQSYVARLPIEDVVDIAQTGSEAGRTDLIVARIEDPFTAGTPWQEPADPAVGPYMFTRVLPNVPASAIASSDAARRYLATQGESAIPLAGVTLPANTATVTGGMVKSLREMANPRRKRDLSTYAIPDNAAKEILSSATGVNFPAANTAWETVEIPEWATEVRVVATWAAVLVPAGNVSGWLAVALGNTGDGANYRTSATVRYDTGSADTTRATYVLGDRLVVPAAYRGTVQPLRMRGALTAWGPTSTTPAQRIALDAASAAILDLEFLEAPTEDDS